MKKLLTTTIYAVSAFTGIIAFAYPFFLPSLLGEGSAAHTQEAPFLTILLLVMCLAVLLVEVQGQAVSAKVVAALGILVAITAVLRFIETAFPGPGGFSPIFVPIILAGYVFGPRFGFLLGVNALLVSALITGYVDPLVPFQMFTTGWVGLTAGWLPHPRNPKVQVVMLVSVGIVWGFLFGAIMNLYSWPFVVDGRATSWQPGVGWREGWLRYAAFYAATSFLWDFGRALGNVLLMAALALPTIRALTRFRNRFQFEVQP